VVMMTPSSSGPFDDCEGATRNPTKSTHPLLKSLSLRRKNVRKGKTAKKMDVLRMRGRGLVPGPRQECCITTRGIGFMRPLLNGATVISMIVGLGLILTGEWEKAEIFYEGTKFLGVWAGGCVLIDCVMVVIGAIDYILSSGENYTDPIRNSMRQRAATNATTFGVRMMPVESETEYLTGRPMGSRRANDAYERPY